MLEEKRKNFQKIKKFSTKNKDLKKEVLINGFFRAEIKYIINKNKYILPLQFPTKF